jgi:hypothetical protein
VDELLLKPSWHGRWHGIVIIVIADEAPVGAMLGTDIPRRAGIASTADIA